MGIINLDKAKLFVYEQRLKELKKAVLHWPDSDKLLERMEEIEVLENKIKALKGE